MTCVRYYLTYLTYLSYLSYSLHYTIWDILLTLIYPIYYLTYLSVSSVFNSDPLQPGKFPARLTNLQETQYIAILVGFDLFPLKLVLYTTMWNTFC